MFYVKYQKLAIYPFQLCFIISDDRDKINEEFTKQGCPEEQWKEGEYIFATTVYGNVKDIVNEGHEFNCTYLVINPYLTGNRLTYGTIAHEMVHVKNKLYRTIGVKADLKNDENEAYLMGHLVDLFIDFYEECAEKEAPISMEAKLHPFALQTKCYEFKAKE